MQLLCSKCAWEGDCSIGNGGLFDVEIVFFGFQLFLVLNEFRRYRHHASRVIFHVLVNKKVFGGTHMS
jgi:hypothetical protein